MKISIECENILLKQTLLLFCKPYLANRAGADFIISDKPSQGKKPIFLIAKDSPHLRVPFTKKELLSTLDDFYSAMQVANSQKPSQAKDLKLEERISTLIDSFKAELLSILRQGWCYTQISQVVNLKAKS